MSIELICRLYQNVLESADNLDKCVFADALMEYGNERQQELGELISLSLSAQLTEEVFKRRCKLQAKLYTFWSPLYFDSADACVYVFNYGFISSVYVTGNFLSTYGNTHNLFDYFPIEYVYDPYYVPSAYGSAYAWLRTWGIPSIERYARYAIQEPIFDILCDNSSKCLVEYDNETDAINALAKATAKYWKQRWMKQSKNNFCLQRLKTTLAGETQVAQEVTWRTIRSTQRLQS